MTDIVNILQFAPAGLKLWSDTLGYVKLVSIRKNDKYPIKVETYGEAFYETYTANGSAFDWTNEYSLWPDKDHKNWWSGYNLILFPRSVGSYVKNTETNTIYKIIDNDGVIMLQNENFIETKLSNASLNAFVYADSNSREVERFNNMQKAFKEYKQTEKETSSTVYSTLFKEIVDNMIKERAAEVEAEANLRKYLNISNNKEYRFSRKYYRPGRRVLVRNQKAGSTPWTFTYFSHISTEGTFIAGCKEWKCCIPYTKRTKRLLGTCVNISYKIV